MTTPDERTRSLVETGVFLRLLMSKANTLGVSDEVQRYARWLERHYLTLGDLQSAHHAMPHMFAAAMRIDYASLARPPNVVGPDEACTGQSEPAATTQPSDAPGRGRKSPGTRPSLLQRLALAARTCLVALRRRSSAVGSEASARALEKDVAEAVALMQSPAFTALADELEAMVAKDGNARASGQGHDALVQAALDGLDDRELYRRAANRLADKARAIDVDIDKLK